MIEQNKEYELKYWLGAQKERVLNTYKKFFEIIDKRMFKNCKVAVDLGCGAYGGVFNELTFQTMYGIDPLYGEYTKNGLKPDNKDIVMLQGTSEILKYKSIFEGIPMIRADCVFSINALDHSGNINQSISDVHYCLKKGGLFALHVQLRSEEQLDSGHRMALYDKSNYMKLFYTTKLCDMTTRLFHFYDRCPFGTQKKGSKKIAAIIGVWEK